MLSPIASRIPHRPLGQLEAIVFSLTEGLIDRGFEVTLFATKDPKVGGKCREECQKGFEADTAIHPEVWECLHIAELFERADDFDLIHTHFGILPLSYARLVNTPVLSTIHGALTPTVLPVYQKYNGSIYYIASSDADRSTNLDYIKTIHDGIDLKPFHFQPDPEDYLLFFGSIHHEGGTKEAIEIAEACHRKLVIAGNILDEAYYKQSIEPCIDRSDVIWVGPMSLEMQNDLMGRAYALLHPVHTNASFDLSVIESMACGTPVIAFNSGCMPEVVEDGRSGFLVENKDDAVQAVARIKDIDRSDCRRHVEEQFSSDQMVEKYIRVYEQIISSEKREDHRPWGYYCVLSDEEAYKVKKIVVFPGKRLSLQRHRKRAEHWYVLEGQAKVTLDSRQFILKQGQIADIPRGSLHRVENMGTGILVFIEVQTGDYFGEDDIERIEDDFGRVS